MNYEQKWVRVHQCTDSKMWYNELTDSLVPLVREIPEGFLSQEPCGVLNIVLAEDGEIITGYCNDPTDTYVRDIEEINDWVLEQVRETPPIKDYLDTAEPEIKVGQWWFMKLPDSPIVSEMQVMEITKETVLISSDGSGREGTQIRYVIGQVCFVELMEKKDET